MRRLPPGRLPTVPKPTPGTFSKAINAGTPRRLFEGRYERSDIGRNYDLAPDGKRFVMIRSDEPAAAARVHVVLNW